MKIGINARFLTRPYTGIGQHTRDLLEALIKQNPKVHFVLATPEKMSTTHEVHISTASEASSIPLQILAHKNVEICTVPEKFFGTAGMKKTYWEQWQLPEFFLQKKVDLVHFPYPSNPWSGFQKPVCVTVHDTIPWTLPAYRRSLLTRFYQDRCRHAVKKADHIFTVSQESKKEVEELCDIPPEKISISYNAPARHFFQTVSEKKKKEALAKYGLNPARRFFFYIGGFDERKNVRTLARVFQEKIAPFHEIDLVLAGGKSLSSQLYGSFDVLTKKRGGSSLQSDLGKLHSIGFVSEEDLPALYQSSYAFVSLSTKEGCNLPLLEALVSRTPLVASDLPVHHEMIGDRALFSPAFDEESLQKILAQLITDQTFYQKQKQKLVDFLLPFSWEKTAKHVMETYQKLFDQ